MNVRYHTYFKYSTYAGVLKDAVKDPVFLTYPVLIRYGSEYDPVSQFLGNNTKSNTHGIEFLLKEKHSFSIVVF